MAADFGQRLVLDGAAMKGAKFADGVVVANFQIGKFPLVLHVLGVFTDGSKLEYPIVLADPRRPLDDHVGRQDRASVNFHPCSDDAIWPDLHVIGQLGRRINDRCRMNQEFCSAAAHMISALATKSPSTSARHSNFQMFFLCVL